VIVVAQETGKLAAQSKQAAHMIEALVNEIMAKDSRAVDTIDRVSERVEIGKDQASAATITCEGIFKELSNNLAQIETVTAAARKAS
jgi:methyl-accepting chemotaxis protein